jgi:GNAT superfamily N-acetyltransferase
VDGGEIRSARADDWGALPEIEARAGERFRDLGMDDVADDEPPSIEALRSSAAVLVALDRDGLPIGYARIELVDGHAHLEQLSVLPEHGGRGVGSDLLDAVVTWASGRGDAEVTLTTFRDVAFNAPVYERRGYEIVPETEWTEGLRELVAQEAAHGLDPRTRVVMRRRLGQ